MSAPSAKVRQATYERDDYRCVACGTPVSLEWQHRQASGMGGRGRKAPKLTPADGIVLCKLHNNGAEAEGQSEALRNGWKVKRNSPMPTDCVPVFYPADQSWHLLNTDGTRTLITDVNAAELMGLALNLGVTN